MVSNSQSSWAVRGATFMLWALVAASATFWGLKLAARPSAAVVTTVAGRAPAPPDPAMIGRLLGSSPAAIAAAPIISLASRFALVGVVAGRSRGGAALIAVDGKPAKPFRVGSAVDDSLMLQSVEPRRALLASSAGGPVVVTLELPPISR